MESNERALESGMYDPRLRPTVGMAVLHPEGAEIMGCESRLTGRTWKSLSASGSRTLIRTGSFGGEQ
jgi:hypothetical protein